MTAEKKSFLSSDAIVILILAVVTWIFSAGLLWQKVDDLEKSVNEIKATLNENSKAKNSYNVTP